MKTDRGAVRALVLALVLAAPAGARAQGAQRLPPDLAAQLPRQQNQGGLRVAGTLGGGYISNPDWRTVGVGTPSAFGSLSLSKTWSGPRFAFSAAGDSRAALYRATAASNRFDYGGTLSLTGALDPRTKLSLTGGASVQHNDQLFDPLTMGVLLPVQRTHTYSASANLMRQLSTRTSVELQGSFAALRFDAQQQANLGDPAQIRNGTGGVASASVSHNVAARSQISAFYTFQTNDYYRVSRVRVHTAGLGYNWAIGTRNRISLAAGQDFYSRVNVPDSSSNGFYVAGNYLLSGRKAQLVTSFRRGIRPQAALGFDRAIWMGSASLTLAPASRVSFSLTGAHSANVRQIDQAEYSYDADEGAASIRSRIGRAVGVSLSGSLRRRSPIGAAPALTSYRTDLVFDFVRTLR